LAETADVIGRLLVVEQLSSKRDHESVSKLGQTLSQDPFYGVRLEASKALRAIHNDEALEALLATGKQSDARVRLQVVTDIGGFYDDKAYASQRKTLESEKNPDILSSSTRALSGYSKPEVNETLIKVLHSESYRNELAVAAIAGMRLEDDPEVIPQLLTVLDQEETNFTSNGYAQGLQALAYLARNQEKKDEVREFLLARVNHKKRAVQLACISALGTLGDPKAIAVLQGFVAASKATPQRSAAERAVAELRAGRKPVDDFKNLRQEVLDLQKANRDLQHQLDDLKKKVDAREGGSPAGARSKTLRPKS
jgi:aminopeptidase N